MITYDPAKRDKARSERGLDFDNAEVIFAGATFDREDTRFDYGKRRVMSVGYLDGRMIVVG